MPDLAGLDEPGHRADRVLDRRLGIDAVLVVQIDVIDAEPLEARIACLPHVLGLAVDPALAVHHRDRELGREHDLVALALDRLADEDLVGVRAVHVRGVEQRDAELERAVDDLCRLVVVARAIERRHPHAPETDGAYVERAKLAMLHARTVPASRRICHPYTSVPSRSKFGSKSPNALPSSTRCARRLGSNIRSTPT
jgi:hypothetical protein